MARALLPALFWLCALAVLVAAVRAGGWALTVPGAVAAAAVSIAVDVYLHRRIAGADLAFVRTALHVLSAVALASGCVYWLATYLMGGAVGF